MSEIPAGGRSTPATRCECDCFECRVNRHDICRHVIKCVKRPWTRGRSTPTPDEALHNPWDASCSRNGFGEPSREGERCLVCFPARPPVGDTTGARYRVADAIRYEVRTQLGLQTGDYLPVHWESVADAAIAALDKAGWP